MFLLALFAGSGLALAMVGVYGILSYFVAQQTHELGLRMALGAKPWSIVKRVLRQGLVLTLIGDTVGLAGALVLTRYLGSFLREVNMKDPSIYLVIALTLLTTLVASYIPARRATKVEPLSALR
jgi:ABC-type antimicrobial peptide transport system permease subunit